MLQVGKQWMTALLVIVLFLLFSNLNAQPKQEDPENTLRPLRIDNELGITGTLSDPVWQQASPVRIKHETRPNDEAAAPVATTVRVLYSKEYLYIGFICKDPHPEKIRAHVADRDESFQDDYVGVILDPFKSNQHAYEFFINPLGVQMDAMRSGNNEDMSYDLLWQSEGAVSDSGYTAVMKIPFKSLHFPQQTVQEWSVQFFRNYPRNSRHQLTWTDVNLDNSCLLCQSGTLAGLKNIETSNTVELLPYGMGYQNSRMNDTDDPSSGLDHERVNGRIGGSISYSPNSTLSLDAVVNPDFSQVETDAAQISANATFALYYPEKRPFFMKGSELFETPEDLFYSRMINRPLAAGKVTQSSDAYTLGVLTAYDRESPFVIPGKLGSSLVQSEVGGYTNIMRGKYNIGDESHIGGLLTTRNQGEGHNYVGSIDWNLRLADNYYFDGQAGFSDTRELQDTTLFNDSRRLGESSYDAAFNGEQYSGRLMTAQIRRSAKYYNAAFEVKSLSPTFQTQSGFINQTDRVELNGSQSLSYYPDKDWLSSGSVNVSGSWRYDYGGQFMERYIYAGWSNTLGGQTDLSLAFLPLNDERYRGRFFRNMNRVMINLSSNPINEISAGGGLEVGRNIYRTENPELGYLYRVSAEATVKPTPRLNLAFSYNHSTMERLDGDGNYYSGNIYRLNSKYNFSRKLFLRLITQYNSFNERLQLYPLLYYKHNPFTKFYIGMTDNLRRYDQPGPQGVNGFRQTQREFFVKFQYLIRR